MSNQHKIEQRLNEAFQLREAVMKDAELLQAVEKAAGVLYLALRNNYAVAVR